MGILDTLSNELEVSVIDEMQIRTDAEIADEAAKEELDMYKAFADSKTPFVVGFAAITPEGDYYVSSEEGGSVAIVMKKEDASRWQNRDVQREKRANLLGIDIDVNVKSVDTENKIVYVEAIKRVVNLKREQVNEELNSLFNAAEKTGSEMCVPVNAVVVGVYDKLVILNIARAGVMARVNISNWARYYVRDLSVVVRRGDTVKINITGKARVKNVRGVQAWNAEHMSFTRDPWESINDKRIGKDSVVVCECVDADYSVNRWWGRPVDSTVLPKNIELLGDMKSDKNGNTAVRPEVGKIYKCTIVYTNFEKHELKVRAYQEVLEDRKKFGVTVKKMEG